MKAPRLSSNRDEICYPYIYETSRLCDYEILTDDLCRQVGGILALLPKELDSLRPELEQLQPMLYHLNGSVRGALRRIGRRSPMAARLLSRSTKRRRRIAWMVLSYRVVRCLCRNSTAPVLMPSGFFAYSLAYRWRKASLFPSRSSALVIFSATTSSCLLLLLTRLMV